MLSAVAHMSKLDAFYREASQKPSSPFTVTVPVGWHVKRTADWVFYAPSDSELPVQGWKIHVSACASKAQQVLDTTAAIAVDLGVAFKHLPDEDKFLWRNGKNCDRRHSGKFIALFPSEDQLPHLLRQLESRLAGLDGPYILSDRRWAQAPIYLRYGLFRPHSVDAGVPDTHLRDPKGNVVPDDRALSFSVPGWAPVPNFLESWLQEVSAVSQVALPFTIDSALTHSNAGGVYLGRYGDTPVIIKEARPHAGLDLNWADAVDRLDREREVLEGLENLPGVPNVLYSGRHWEHLYLVEEYLPGIQLQSWIHYNEPRQRTDPRTGDQWAASCHSVLVALRTLLSRLHGSGWAHMDVHPGNVLINPTTLDVSLIDFENSVPSTAQHRTQIMAAPGYGLQGLHSPRRHDLYGLSRIAASMLWISRSESAVEPNHLHTVLDLARHDHDHPWLRPGASATDALLDEIEDISREVAGIEGSVITPIAPVRALNRVPERSWTRELRNGLIAASALHHQKGRIYPVHYRGLEEDWTGIASGDATIARVLGASLPSFPTPNTRHLGLMNGLVGDLLALEKDFPHETAEVVRTKLDTLLASENYSVFSGLPGILLGLTRLRVVKEDGELSTRVAEAVESLARRYIADPEFIVVSKMNRGNDPRMQSTGLLYGNLGLAWVFNTALRQPGFLREVDLLETACTTALARELASYTEQDGSFLADQGTRGLPYLATGSAGFGVLLPRVREDLWPEGLRSCLPGLRKACDAPGSMFAGLFNGYAGLLLGYAGLTRLLDENSAAEQAQMRLRRSLERNAVGLVSATDSPAAMICGDGWRLSGDVATGTAGVLVALRALENAHEDLLGWIFEEDPR